LTSCTRKKSDCVSNVTDSVDSRTESHPFAKNAKAGPPGNGAQTLLILPDINFSGHKKATVEANTVKCVERCELLSAAPNP